jgi:bifunctional UDP-N-acetylglucosamine pyrophosphorylase/glucosamine-1-phosphate N-acetyltransferase
LKEAGATGFVVVVGYMGHKVKGFFGESFQGAPISYVMQEQRNGTAKAIGLAKEFCGKEDFLVSYTDIVFGPRLWRALLEKKGFDAVIAIRKDKHPERYGNVLTRGARIVEIIEKPKPEEVKSHWVLVGAYRFSPKIFEAIEATPISARGEFEITDSLKILMQQGKVGFEKYIGKFFDIGSLEDLKAAEGKLAKEA